jgi:hypothetical protein
MRLRLELGYYMGSFVVEEEIWLRVEEEDGAAVVDGKKIVK